MRGKGNSTILAIYAREERGAFFYGRNTIYSKKPMPTTMKLRDINEISGFADSMLSKSAAE